MVVYSQMLSPPLRSLVLDDDDNAHPCQHKREISCIYPTSFIGVSPNSVEVCLSRDNEDSSYQWILLELPPFQIKTEAEAWAGIYKLNCNEQWKPISIWQRHKNMSCDMKEEPTLHLNYIKICI